jgi:hypothetical protein
MSLKTSWYIVFSGIALQILLGGLWGFGMFGEDAGMQKNDAVTLIAATSIQVLMMYMVFKMDNAEMQKSRLHRLLLVTGALLAWMTWEVFIKS